MSGLQFWSTCGRAHAPTIPIGLVSALLDADLLEAQAKGAAKHEEETAFVASRVSVAGGRETTLGLERGGADCLLLGSAARDDTTT